ncbi:Sedoheptulokinase [Phytophthora megakarya]|uniref:Sedoheptulokinase n=1 Tax=Phytophthora megakarya TaxID=4795 RepID=A0A225V7G8_9STRA|nr:Sedoheptulokinase [Phytophthora megakarya]
MVRKWLSNKTELEAAVALDANKSGRQRKLGSGRRPNAAIDSALLQWVKRKQADGKSLTDREMQQHARTIAQELGFPDFHASNGYIYSFKNRNKLATSSANKRQKVSPAGVAVQVSQEAQNGDERDCMFGIDIGLKNVKCALVCATTGNILATSSAPIQHDAKLKESEQSVANILLTVLSTVKALPTTLRLGIRSVGICGVMHGIVWWRCNAIRQAMCELLSRRDSAVASAKNWPWSAYITFLDQRCTPSMLTEWRAKIQLANATATVNPFGIDTSDVCASTSPIASGYGLATFTYMLERHPHEIMGFDACGTIQDFIAFALCGHSIPAQNSMDVTDAFSWGGFDITTKTWNPHTVQALGLPAHMLPTVKAPGAIIGQSSDFAGILGLPNGKPVYLAMGDHPCAVMTTMAQTRGPADLNLSRTSVLSIGSASQLAMVLTEEDAAQLKLSRGSCSLSFEVRPFLSENWYLGVAGSLSGGNIFAWFVKQCQAWSRQLAVDPTAEHLSDDATYARLISLGGTKLDTDLRFSPTLYGEWASPEVRGSIEHLRISNWSLGDISASICRGLVDNIFSMVPEDLRTDLLQQPYKLAHPSQLSIQSTADAAVGVAFIPSLLQK